jgi:acyl transferase domain-containing protein/acyl carrier protein
MAESQSAGLTPEKQALLALRKLRARVEELERARNEPIAIVGIGCRLPGGVTTPEAFWDLLRGGTDAVSDVPAERWDVDAYYDPDPDAAGKMYTRRGGFLSGIDAFDARHFGITPREAISMDPQQRLLLEVTWEALERAGQAPDRLSGSDTGVFIGISTNDYGQILLRASDQIDPGMYFGTGNLLNAAAGRLSYVLGLQGPSMAVDTACSSSLVAIHVACSSLRNRECRMALAGGANLVLVPEVTVNCCRAKMLAPDGRCKTFDAAADGYVRGEGCAIVVLKRLSDAVADGNRVLAVIRGSAVNQDGRSGGFTAPNELAQQAVIRTALAAAGVAPAEIGYVEAHGTGTPLGDPIEIHAIAAALGEGRAADAPLTVGSVKTNVGHLEAAAGVAGLIKVVLTLQHEEIPPHLHFRELNPHIELGGFPLEIPRAPRPWARGAARRIAGVSSFGFTGTNAHVIVEEAPLAPLRDQRPDRPAHVLALSARTEDALRQLARAYSDHLAASGAPLGDICYTAAHARASFDHRLAVVAADAAEARERLAEAVAGSTDRVHAATVRSRDDGVVFLFTGQGSQYAGMGRELYGTQPVFRAAIDRCSEIVGASLDRPLLPVLYPGAGDASPIDETAWTQPALFAIEYALAELWRSWGIQPSAVLGHSIGEFVAACVAGAISLDDALRLVVARARLMQALPAGGAMAAITADEARVRHALSSAGSAAARVSIAALNGPANTVIAGDAAGVQAAVDALAADSISAKRLAVSHAFHSPLMEPMLDEFERIASQIPFAPPQVPLVSNVTGALVGHGFRFDGAYWRRHAREAVRFADGISTLLARGDRVFLEIGPSPTLCAMGQRVPGAEGAAWLASMRKGRAEWRQLLDAVAGLYVRGVSFDWNAFDRPYARRKADLPTYPFQRERYWVQMPVPVPPPAAARADAEPGLYATCWTEAEPESAPADAAGSRLVVADDDALASAVQDEFARIGETCSTVPASILDDDNAVELMRGALPRSVVFVVTAAEGAPEDLDLGARACRRLTALVRAIEQVRAPQPPRIFIVTTGVQPPSFSSGSPSTAASPVWGFGRIVGLEHPGLWGGLIDLPTQPSATDVSALVRHVCAPQGEDQVALAGGRRYVPRLDRMDAPARGGLPLAADATYLITGGLGSLGLSVARRLVTAGARSLALLGRRGLPARTEWAGIDPASDAGRQIEAVISLESSGATVHVVRADVSDAADLGRALRALAMNAPPLRGIVHAAGVSQNADVVKVTPDVLRSTFASKVAGAWRLHEATAALSLDFFVLFSSVSSVWGSRGLAAYAAANQYLDTLAHRRRALGLPATSINWGPWAGGGMMDDQGAQWLAAMGVRALDPPRALDALERVLASSEPQAVVATMDWSLFLPVYEAKGRRRFMDRVRGAAGADARSVGDSAFVERLAPLAPAERRAAIIRATRERVAGVIGTGGPETIALDEAFFALGLDSLMATELRRALERQFDRALSPTLTFDYPTVSSLADYIERELFPGAGGDARVLGAAEAAAYLAQLPAMTDAEVDALLMALDPSALNAG